MTWSRPPARSCATEAFTKPSGREWWDFGVRLGMGEFSSSLHIIPAPHTNEVSDHLILVSVQTERWGVGGGMG